MMKRGILTVLAMAAVACNGDVGPTGVDGEAYLIAEAEVELQYGETREVEGTVLRVSFTEVLGDSRCPTDVTCIWQGNARVQVGIAAGTGPTHPLLLNTGIQPLYADWDGVRVTLLEVMPQAQSTVNLDPEDYSIRIHLEEAGS